MSHSNHANIHCITWQDKEILLVGTAHVSSESADLVEQVIREEKPDTVSVELCESRYQALTQEHRWQETDLLKAIREKKAFLLLMNLILSYFQRKIGRNLGVRPGEEMLRAVRTAEENGAAVHLADRDIRVTLARAWRLMGLWSKIKLFAQLLVSSGELDDLTPDDIEELKQKDVLEALLDEIGEGLPEIRSVLIDERDLYLAEKIRQSPGRKVVAVVGAGHVPGIRKHFGKDVDLLALNEVPPGGPWKTLFKWGLPLLILVIFTAGFFRAGPSAGMDMLKLWVLANGVLGGLGAAAALAHPLTVVSAVAASPLTSLNPMMAAGWVAGLVEAFISKPKVRDFENLSGDLSSVKGFWRNKISRILLVVVFTNIGSSLGTFVAIPLMVRVFA
ncbi:MAG: TraB/GumN family protein [Thermodesulfobacteriota bacterium]